MNVQVTRWDPETDSRPHLQLYQVPLPADGTHTVMDVLDYIYEKLDGTLSGTASVTRESAGGARCV